MQIAALLYRLSIAFWTGGTALFTFILTPMLFKALSRDQAGQIVGILFPGYFRWGLACGAVALICRLIMRGTALVPACLLVVMLALTSFQAFSIEPRAAALKRQIPSFDTTPKEHPLRKEFAKLHGISAGCNLAVVAGGIALVIMP
ncbi:DUF4149 domain-containing protein [Geobacter sp. FeAm09]|uniref:DUF4149 domain-containing protein n=1 Tax=Geobacter sp. FeAm09 TaxID=2597769 RepID=UPI0011EDAF96|nr:DUF4149 domain-containing protein [Geobacter sp. FeAm09]QEM67961.1 DUF4149 domain-containing protein [Geobacter sp. FeAm09]